MTAACWQVAHRPTEPGRGSRGSGIATDSTEFTERKAIWPRTARNTRRKPVWYSVPSVLSVTELFPCLSVARHEKRFGHGLRGIPGENPFGTPYHPCFPWPNSLRVFPWLATKSDLATDCAEYPEKTRLVLRAIRAFRDRTLSVSFRGSPRKAIWPRTARNTRRKPVWYSVPSVLSVAELSPCLSVARHEKRFGHGLRGIPGENPFGAPCHPCFPWPNSFRVFPWLATKSDLATDCAEYPEKTRLVLRAIRAFRDRTLSVSFRGSPRKAIWPRTARNTRRKPVWYFVPSVLSMTELFPCLSVARHEKRFGHGLRGIPGENPFGTSYHPCFP